jgi:hypothetical protein
MEIFMNTTIKSSLSAILIFLSLLIVSCGGDDKYVATGELLLNIEEENVLRTLEPGIDMNISEYSIHGDGPGGFVFDVTTADASVIIPELKFGNWTITVSAMNSAGTIIADGTETTLLQTTDTTVLSVIVRPLAGSGNLDLTLNWTKQDTYSPSVVSELTASDGTVQSLPFTINGNGDQATHQSVQNSGYYTMVLKLLDNSLLTFGHVEVVRIIKDETTTGNFTFNDINEAGITLEVQITPEMGEPIDVTLSGVLPSILVAETMTVTASVPVATDPVIYTWYVNGEIVDATNTNSYTFTGTEDGFYNLGVTVYTVDGQRAGSNSHLFEVLN